MKYFSRKRLNSLYTDNDIWTLTWSDYKSSLHFIRIDQVSVMAIEVAGYLVASVGVYEGVARPEL